MAGLQLIKAIRSVRSVNPSVDRPIRAHASAASQPAWPNPTTMTSKSVFTSVPSLSNTEPAKDFIQQIDSRALAGNRSQRIEPKAQLSGYYLQCTHALRLAGAFQGIDDAAQSFGVSRRGPLHGLRRTVRPQPRQQSRAQPLHPLPGQGADSDFPIKLRVRRQIHLAPYPELRSFAQLRNPDPALHLGGIGRQYQEDQVR